MPAIQFLDAQDRFNAAIQRHFLSPNRNDPHYCGSYMYMGTWQRSEADECESGLYDAFKHIDSRRYTFIPSLPFKEGSHD